MVTLDLDKPIHFLQLAVKRGLDIIGSLLGLVLFSPVFVVTAIAIKITSPGPILFYQERIGENGKPFICYKFRSMVVNADELKQGLLHLNEMNGPVFKITRDPRITRVGEFIRKTSIDELPQFLNVLKGEMSLVGPRPPLPGEVKQYKSKHLFRLSVKPGLTCIWQVSGRNSLDFEQWMKLDAEYVQNWSIWLDIKILFQTIPAVITRRGAC